MPLVILPAPFDILVAPINYMFDLTMSQIKAKLEAMIDIIIDTLTNTFSAIGKTLVDLITGLIDLYVTQLESMAKSCVDIVDNVLGPIVRTVAATAETILNGAFAILDEGSTKLLNSIATGFDSIISQASMSFNISLPQLDAIDLGAFRSTIDSAFGRATSLIDSFNVEIPNFQFPIINIDPAIEMLNTLETRATDLTDPIANQITGLRNESTKQLDNLGNAVSNVFELPSEATMIAILIAASAGTVIVLGILIKTAMRL